MTNPIARIGTDLINAAQALRLKRHWLVPTRDGVVIQQPGKPDLLLTAEAARRWANEMAEGQQ